MLADFLSGSIWVNVKGFRRDDVSGSFCWRRLRSIWCDSCVWAPLKRHTDCRNAVEPKVGRLYFTVYRDLFMNFLYKSEKQPPATVSAH